MFSLDLNTDSESLPMTRRRNWVPDRRRGII